MATNPSKSAKTTKSTGTSKTTRSTGTSKTTKSRSTRAATAKAGAKQTTTTAKGSATQTKKRRSTSKAPAGTTKSRRKPSRPAFKLAEHTISAGKRMRIELPIGKLMSGTPVALPLIVVHGKGDGPVVWLSAAIHGDEICGVEIIRQVLDTIKAPEMNGTVIAAPIVNVHGFNTNDRYLPDRRDLNRSFPGSSRGSLASRIASLFMKEVVNRSDVGVDLHTGSDLRTNLAQIRCDIDHAPTLRLANDFGAPIVIDARLRDGSLRQAAVEAGKIMMLFEGGEASRFDHAAISAGTAGSLRVLNQLGVTDLAVAKAQVPLYARQSWWSRAPKSGVVHLDATLGDLVHKGERIAAIYDAFGKMQAQVKSKYDGLVIGHSQAPLVNRGDAITHIARLLPDAPKPGWAVPGLVDGEEVEEDT